MPFFPYFSCFFSGEVLKCIKGGIVMKIVKVNKAKNNVKDLKKITEMTVANALLDACGCTGNGYCH